MELKKQKLQSQTFKVEKQKPEKEKTADQPQQGNNDDDDMPMLVSDNKDPNLGQVICGKEIGGPEAQP